jgi:hypothetical protein
MRNLLVFLIVAAVLAAWGYQKSHEADSGRRRVHAAADLQVEAPDPVVGASSYSCDGRKRCSQMSSCKEATWFIRNCPGMEMDGDADGVPCESQWCGR